MNRHDPRRRLVTRVGACLAFAATLAIQSNVRAAGPAGFFTGKTVKIIVPQPAGGTSDTLARLLSAKLNETLGATFIVDNRPGATGNLGADVVAKSPKDGLTLMLTDIGSLAIAPSVFSSLPFDPTKDFAPIVMVAYSPHLLAVNADLPVKDVRELIALAKAKPNSLNFAISGLGGANHLAGIDFALRTGIQWAYIPYKGGSQAIADVMSGQAQVLFNGMVATLPSVKGGKLRALAVSSSKRFPGVTEIPTVAEAAGLPGFETGSFQGIVGPAGMPAAAVAQLHAAVTTIIATPDMQTRLTQLGAEPRPSSSAEFGAFIGSEKTRWAKVVKDSGAKFD